VTLELALWLGAGIVCFFLARASWQLSFGCTPVTVGTLIAMMFAMWLPPISLLAAITWLIEWAADADDRNPSVIVRLLRTPIANPCKWFSRGRTP
jgi:hypothetical protein